MCGDIKKTLLRVKETITTIMSQDEHVGNGMYNFKE